MLEQGDPAPDFTLTTHEGKQLRLADLRGRKVLLWFYVEADTPGCTLEGRGFRDQAEYFADNNIEVVGASFDGVQENAAFAQKHAFTFPLMSDSTRAVAIAYGACSDPKARYPGRISFLIDEQGMIERVYDRVDPRDHAARVLADVLGV